MSSSNVIISDWPTVVAGVWCGQSGESLRQPSQQGRPSPSRHQLAVSALLPPSPAWQQPRHGGGRSPSPWQPPRGGGGVQRVWSRHQCGDNLHEVSGGGGRNFQTSNFSYPLHWLIFLLSEFLVLDATIMFPRVIMNYEGLNLSQRKVKTSHTYYKF